jgi:predicted RNase H-like HicB family nuclease
MEKTVDYYMTLPYTVIVTRPPEGGLFASVKELKGCWADGDTWEELGKDLELVMRTWFEIALEDGATIPEPEPVHS